MLYRDQRCIVCVYSLPKKPSVSQIRSETARKSWRVRRERSQQSGNFILLTNGKTIF